VQHLIGMYRIPPQEARKEEAGRRQTPARPGITFVPLWNGKGHVVLSITDSDKHQLVDAIPPEATRVETGFNRDGVVPSGVCDTIRLALELQQAFAPKKTQTKRKSTS
jgi:hypothetical protein